MQRILILSMFFVCCFGCKSLPPEIRNGEYDLKPNKFDYLATAVMFSMDNMKTKSKETQAIIENMIDVWNHPHRYKLFNYDQSICKECKHLPCVYIRHFGIERKRLNQFRLSQFNYWLENTEELPFREEVELAIKELNSGCIDDRKNAPSKFKKPQ